ncbi:MAG TPA: glycosyltransferase [Candidatus Binatia bacterium]|nr:glycosyltransferase [Candidatus Binatia bacterium]
MSLPGIREANAAVLRERAPELLARIAGAEVPATHVVRAAETGEPCLAIAGVPLQSFTDPVADGRRWAIRALERLEGADAERVAVVGLALGHHVEALAARWTGRIAIVEPDLAVWRLALAHRDLAAVLARAEPFADEEPGGGTVAPPAANAEAAATDAGARAPAAPGESAVPTAVLTYAPALLVAGGRYRRAAERWQSVAALAGLRLRVLVVSPIYGGSWPIAGYAARALAELGHDARLLDLSPFHESLRRLEAWGASKARQARMESRFCDALGEAVVGAVERVQPDIVLALAQAPLAAEALSEIGKLGVPRALWFVEDVRRFGYWRDVARHYDWIFTIQDDDCLEEVARATDAAVAYLPCAFDATVHRPLALDASERAAFGSPVSFVGAGYRNRRRALRTFLDCGLRIWGSDWDGADDLADAVQRDGERVSTDDAVRVFNASAVNLNLHSSTWHDGVDPAGDFVNPRTFELAGSGAFQIVDRRRLLPTLFEAGREIAVADSVAEMKAMALDFLADPDARRAIADRGRARALAEHRYAHRMRSLVAAIAASHGDRLRRRARRLTVADVRSRRPGELDAWLARLDPDTPFALDDLSRDICKRPGALAESEAIVLFLHQFDELYLAEQRA